MSEYDYDLYVIGGGSGGVRAARIAAGYGARVGLCEESRLGGTCVIRGCVPKKLLMIASHISEDLEDAAGYGWSIDGWSFSWPKLIATKDKALQCQACHSEGGRMDWQTLGYDGDPIKQGSQTRRRTTDTQVDADHE